MSGSPFGIDLNSLSAEDVEGLGQVSKQILSDPLLLQQLTDRVYRLMQDDLSRQAERGFGRRSHGR
ncbi:MAG: hypothetical protein AAF268_09195 [Cyanobacteria bacterium P01_A01_bin.3]